MSDSAKALRLQLAKLSPSERARLLERLGQTAAAEGSTIPRRAQDGPAPLSYNQEILWTLDQALPGLTAYNVPRVLRIKGPLDVGALQISLDALVERHEPLRTRFHSRGGVPEQVVGGALPVAIRTEDLSSLGGADRDAALAECVRARIADRFDLARDQLLQATLVRLGAEDQVLILLTHHIVCDEWSRDVLYRELSALYSAARTGRTAALPPLPIRYTDYAAWQRQPVQEAGMARDLEYWRDRLKDLPTLEIPTDYPRSGLPSFEGARARFEFPADVIESLRALARTEGTTLYVALLTVYIVLLHRYSAQEDIVVGSPVSTRGHEELEGLIGYFPNLMILRTSVSGNPSFRALVNRVKNGYLDAFEHRNVPLEQLALEVREGDRPRSEPLVRIAFVAQEGVTPAASLEGTDVSQIAVDPGTAKFELLLALQETGDGWRGMAEYRTDLFERPTIERLITHFERLARSAAAEPDAPVSGLPLLSDAERHQVLEEWNDTQAPYPDGMTLTELLEHQALRTPNAEAIRFEAAALSYSDLHARANQLAHGLRGLGVGPGVTVGICAERSLELVVGLLGILKAGGAYVPLDPEYPAERLRFMMEDAAVPVLLTQQHLVGLLPPVRPAVVYLDGGDFGTQPVTALARSAGPDDPAYMIYTSGSTGRPKGALNAHRGIVNRLHWMQETFRLGGDDTVLQKTPFSFDVSVWEFFWPLLAGARLVLASPGGHRDPVYLTELIARERVTIVHFVPSMLLAFLAEPAATTATTLRDVMCSGEALPRETLLQFGRILPARLHNLYGPTEAAVDVTWWACDAGYPRGIVPIGRPIANTTTYILDAMGQPVPIGVPGELFLGGVQVGLGYWNRPELTRERFVPDPFSKHTGARLYRTGDRARYLPDGNIEYLGRLDFQVKIRGFRIELGEIESVLTQHPAVCSTTVLAQADGSGDQRLVAYIVAEPNQAAPDARALRRYLAERLPAHMVPSAVVILETLPLTPNGKVDRQQLRSPAATRAERVFAPPGSATESVIAAIWAQVLGIDPIGADDRFLGLGGQSLQAMRILGRIRESLGVRLPPSLLLRDGSVAEVAAAADAAAAARDTGEDDGLVAVSRQGFTRPGGGSR